MKRFLKSTAIFVYFGLCFTLMMSRTAFAYLDPATTSYIIQIVSGVFIACGVAVGVFWKKISLFFRKLRMKALEKKLTRQGEKRQS